MSNLSVLAQPINPMDPKYGARNDGTTDDTAAVNAAIADYNASGGRPLYLPGGGGFNVTDLTTLASSGKVYGDGLTASALFFSGLTGTAGLTISGPATLQDVTVEIVDGSTQPVLAAGGSPVRVERCNIAGVTGRGIEVRGAGVTIRDSVMSGALGVGDLGFIYAFGGIADLAIENCDFGSVLATADATSAYIYVAGAIEGLVVARNYCTNASANAFHYGLYVGANASDYLRVYANDFHRFGTAAISINSSGTHIYNVGNF